MEHDREPIWGVHSDVVVIEQMGNCGVKFRAVVGTTLFALSLAACAGKGAVSSSEFALPTVPSAVSSACRGVGLRATLHGDPSDPRIAWVVYDGGGRRDVIWPTGYRARFAPRLEVLDTDGRVVLGEGDRIEGACVTDDPNVLLLVPPFT